MGYGLVLVGTSGWLGSHHVKQWKWCRQKRRLAHQDPGSPLAQCLWFDKIIDFEWKNTLVVSSSNSLQRDTPPTTSETGGHPDSPECVQNLASCSWPSTGFPPTKLRADPFPTNPNLSLHPHSHLGLPANTCSSLKTGSGFSKKPSWFPSHPRFGTIICAPTGPLLCLTDHSANILSASKTEGS